LAIWEGGNKVLGAAAPLWLFGPKWRSALSEQFGSAEESSSCISFAEPLFPPHSELNRSVSIPQ